MSIAQDWMTSAVALPGGNTQWASEYGHRLREAIVRQAHRAPRNMQTHLGPSELGEVCDRQVIGKMSGQPITNHVSDPWASIVGTAVHAWLASAFLKENSLDGFLHWLPEVKVAPHPEYPGSSDLYDALQQTVVDWKILGETSMAKVRSPAGPPRRYQVQLLLYAKGWANLGLPVRRVALAALPRTQPTLDSMYVWEHLIDWERDDIFVSQVIAQTHARHQVAQAVLGGQIPIEAVPITPGDDNCFWCPFYRPQSARDGGPGCPGHSLPR